VLNRDNSTAAEYDYRDATTEAERTPHPERATSLLRLTDESRSRGPSAGYD
jgi:hypothetical protein